MLQLVTNEPWVKRAVEVGDVTKAVMSRLHALARRGAERCRRNDEHRPEVQVQESEKISESIAAVVKE